MFASLLSNGCSERAWPDCAALLLCLRVSRTRTVPAFQRRTRQHCPNEYGLTCFQGLEPSEVRLDSSAPSNLPNPAARRMHTAPNYSMHSWTYVDDDMESVASASSGFSTDTATTTDTYPSCSASPGMAQACFATGLDADSPARRNRAPVPSFRPPSVGPGFSSLISWDYPLALRLVANR